MVLMEYFSYLPVEITLDILSRLPADSVLDCKLVCRNWRSLVLRPSFSKMHLHQVNVAADSEIKVRAGMYYRGTGFGYVSSTNEYKVVRVTAQEDTEVYIYTLGSGLGWRNLGKFDFGTCGQLEEDGIFLNGALYWLNSGSQIIVPFDLAEEKFLEHLPLHSPLDDDFEEYHYELGVLNGFLSLTINHQDDDGTECWDVWLLKDKNDNHCMKEGEEHHSMGWSEEFRVCANEPFAATKSYNLLTYSGHHINIQEPEASTSKTIVDFNEFISRVYPHKNTVISLKELGEEEVKIMESVEIADAETHD